jgi:hypothetical protein
MALVQSQEPIARARFELALPLQQALFMYRNTLE